VDHHGQQRMESGPAGPARMVSDLRAFPVPTLRLHRRVPIQHHRLRQRPPYRLRVAGDSLRTEHRIHGAKETPHRIVTHHRLHFDDLRDHRIFPQPLNMREAATVRQRRQDEGLEHVIDRSRVRTGPLHGTVPGQPIDDTYIYRNGSPRNQSAERRQAVLSDRQLHPPTEHLKRKLPFTQRVNRHRLARGLHKSVPQQLLRLPPSATAESRLKH
jgi:hypothetical protein